MIKQLRKHFATDSSKDYYITGAPQCPYPDAMLGTVLDAVEFDAVNVQFYNNYCAATSSSFNFDTWNAWATKSSPNPDVKVFLGLPGSSAAAGSGYVAFDSLEPIVKELHSSYSNFGGVTLWDASASYDNTDVSPNYQAAVADLVHDLPSNGNEGGKSTTSSTPKKTSTKTKSHKKTTSKAKHHQTTTKTKHHTTTKTGHQSSVSTRHSTPRTSTSGATKTRPPSKSTSKTSTSAKTTSKTRLTKSISSHSKSKTHGKTTKTKATKTKGKTTTSMGKTTKSKASKSTTTKHKTTSKKHSTSTKSKSTTSKPKPTKTLTSTSESNTAGSPTSCVSHASKCPTEGQMVCSGDSFATCNHGKWEIRQCPSSLTCFSTTDGSSIYCGQGTGGTICPAALKKSQQLVQGATFLAANTKQKASSSSFYVGPTAKPYKNGRVIAQFSVTKVNAGAGSFEAVINARRFDQTSFGNTVVVSFKVANGIKITGVTGGTVSQTGSQVRIQYKNRSRKTMVAIVGIKGEVSTGNVLVAPNVNSMKFSS